MADSAQKSAAKSQSAPTTRRAPVRAPSPGGGYGALQSLTKLHAVGGNHAVHAMLSGGIPLSSETREEFEGRFGADLSDVRVHDGGAAHSSAAALSANAYTFGSNIVFAANRFAPHSPHGKRLLAHEVAHVIQQRRGGAAPAMRSDAGHERGADAAASAFSAGQGAISVQGATSVGIARDAEKKPAAKEDTVGAFGDAAIDSVAEFIAGGPGLQKRMIAAAMRGFAAELVQQLVVQGKAERAQEHLLELLNPTVYAKFSASYLAGLLAGFVSPVTDLFGIPAFVDSIGDFMQKLEMSALANAKDLMTGGSDLRKKFNILKDEASKAVHEIFEDLAKDPSKIFELIDRASDAAVQAAGSVGHGAAKEVISVFESPWEEEKDEDPGWSSVLPKDTLSAAINPGWAGAATLSRAWEYGTERAKKKLFSTPWSKVGYAVGHAIGAIIANLLLLIFTEGIGDAIAAIGKTLGELAPALRAVESIATKIAEVLKVVGGAVKTVEEGIAAVAKTVLKPLEKVLKPFLDVLESLQTWLRKLFGVAEREGAAAEAAAAKLAKKVGEEKKLLPTTHGTPPEVKPLPTSKDTGPSLKGGPPEKPLTKPGEHQRKLDPKDPKAKDVKVKGPATQDPKIEEPDVKAKDPKAKDPKAKDPKAKDPKAKDPKAKDPKAKDPKAKDPKAKDPKAKDPKAKDPKAKDPKAKDPKAKDPKAKDPKAKDPKAKDPKAKDPKAKDPKAKDPKAKDPKAKDPKGTKGGQPKAKKPQSKPKTKRASTPKGAPPPKKQPVIEDPYGMRRDPTNFDRRTAGTGGIKKIQFGKDPEGRFSVKIKGELQEGLYRGSGKPPAGKTKAPNYNRSRSNLFSNKEVGLPAGEWEDAHLWGPGFGDEAAAGMMKAPRGVNQWYQNQGIEGYMRDVRKAADEIAKVTGEAAKVEVEATAVAWDLEKGGWQPKAQADFLKRAEYRVNVTSGGKTASVNVTIDVPRPPATEPISIFIDPPGAANPADLLNIVKGKKGP